MFSSKTKFRGPFSSQSCSNQLFPKFMILFPRFGFLMLSPKMAQPQNISKYPISHQPPPAPLAPGCGSGLAAAPPPFASLPLGVAVAFAAAVAPRRENMAPQLEAKKQWLKASCLLPEVGGIVRDVEGQQRVFLQ